MQEYFLFWGLPVVFLLANISLATDRDNNSSDIFVSYAGHSEVKDEIPVPIPKTEDAFKDNEDLTPKTNKSNEMATKPETDVVFIPNEKPVFRNEDDYIENDRTKLTDVIDNRKIGDVVNNADVTEPTNEGVLFISGKNNENVEKIEKKDKHSELKTKDKAVKTKKLDCVNLDCENAVNSVCGAKFEDKTWKHRLFMNECFFRKVNCAFKYPNNRYKQVDIEKCKHIGNHLTRRSDVPIAMSLNSNIEETRRSFSSRRSLNADINGQSCSHPCPIACTERYEPQCAVSSAGQRRTFLNHCKLDYNSCLNKIAWYIRPLSECVGGKKADVQQNRGFIAWMQKVGIVDGRGRLTLSKGLRPR